MEITTNETTTKHGPCAATVILCTESQTTSKRITTLELVYPRFIHAEFMTHRAFSRNAQSSRATPTKLLIKEVMTDPVKPAVFYKNAKGMSGKELLAPDLADDAVGTC